MYKAKKLAKEHNLSKKKAKELAQLLNDMKRKGFKRSKQLSDYIVEKKLGHKYPEISGILEMKEGDETWDFEGGFPTNIYRIICYELGLANEGSITVPGDFRSYAELMKKHAKAKKKYAKAKKAKKKYAKAKKKYAELLKAYC